MTGADVVAAATTLLGTPFVHQGRLPGKALDCAGVVVATASALGIAHTDVVAYGRIPALGILRAVLDSQPELVSVSPADLQPGDVLLMRFKKEPQHLAIFAGKTIIHAWQVIGRVVQHDFDSAWCRRVVAAYRFREVSNG